MIFKKSELLLMGLSKTYLLLAPLVTFLFMITTNSFIADKLGSADYGKFSYYNTIISYLSLILLPGLTLWSTREAARNISDVRPLIKVVIKTRILLLMPAICVGYIVFNILESGNDALIAMAYLTTPITNIQWVFQGINARVAYCVFAASNSFAQFAGLFISFKFFLAPTIQNTVIISVLLQFFIFFLFIEHIRRTLLPLDTKPKIGIINVITNSMPLNYTSVLVTIIHNINPTILKFVTDDSIYGNFYAAFKLTEFVSIVPSYIAGFFISKIMNIRLGKNFMENDFYNILIISIAFSVSSSILIYLNSDHIIYLLYRSAFVESADYLKYLSVAILFNSLSIFGTIILIALDKDPKVFRSVIFGFIASIISAPILIKIYGVHGALMSLTIIDFITATYLFINIINSSLFSKYYPLSINKIRQNDIAFMISNAFVIFSFHEHYLSSFSASFLVMAIGSMYIILNKSLLKFVLSF